MQLVRASEANIVEFLAVIGIPGLHGEKNIREYSDGVFRHVPIVTLVGSDAITEKTCGDPPNWPKDTPRIQRV